MLPVETVLPEGFKMTELGPLPEEWEVVRLGEVVSAFSGLWGEDAESIPGKVLVRVIRVSDITEENLVNYLSAPTRMITQKQFHKYRLMRSDILVVKSSGSKTRVISGRCAYFEPESDSIPFLPSNFILALRSKTEMVHSRFLWFYLLTKESQARVHQMTEGSTYPNLKVSEYLTLPIPLPPLPDQRAIAHVLRTVQRAKEATEMVIAAARELKKSLMRHLFTYGPVPLDQADQVRLQETEIGPVPERWEVVRLGKLEESGVLLMRSGFACGTHNEKGVGIPQLRPMNISESGDVVLSNLKYVETDEDVTRYLLQTNDVIFNNTNSEELVGKTGIWLHDAKFVVSNHMTILRILKPEIVHPYYLARHLHWKWLNGYYRTICRRYVAQAGVSLERLRHVSVPLPPLPEQRAIAEILRVVDRKLEAEQRRKASLDALFRTLLHHLMTGKVRVAPGFVQQFNQEFSHE